MPHEIAKLILDHAGTFVDRTEAIETALYLGVPLRQIEEYLDWLDMIRSQADEQAKGRETARPATRFARRSRRRSPIQTLKRRILPPIEGQFSQ